MREQTVVDHIIHDPQAQLIGHIDFVDPGRVRLLLLQLLEIPASVLDLIQLEQESVALEQVFLAKFLHGDAFAVDGGDKLAGNDDLLEGEGNRDQEHQDADDGDDAAYHPLLQLFFSFGAASV